MGSLTLAKLSAHCQLGRSDPQDLFWGDRAAAFVGKPAQIGPICPQS